jgi:hypothetical protein
MKRKPVKPLKLFPYEIFDKVQSVRAMKDRVEILQENESFVLKSILQINFNDWIQFDLPEGEPPFTKDKNPPEFSAGRIEKQIKLLKMFIPESKLSRVKKEVKFIQLLESLHYKDSEIIVAIKDKKLNKLYPALTPVLIKKAFPTVIKDK